MKKRKTTQVIASTLAMVSIIAMNQVKANATWKQDSIGWWYTEGNSWATGWRVIDSNWYYFYSDGYMARNQSIDGYYVDSNGAWTQSKLTLDEAVNLINKNMPKTYKEYFKVNLDDFTKEIDCNSSELKIGSTNVFDVIGYDENLYYFYLGSVSFYIGTNSGKLYISSGGSGVITLSLIQNGEDVKNWAQERKAKYDENGKQIGWNYNTLLVEY